MKPSIDITNKLVDTALGILKPGTYHDIENQISIFLREQDRTSTQTKKLEKKIYRKLFEVKIKWPSTSKIVEILSPYREPDPYELIGLFRKRSYASFFFGLFLNGLIDQVPKTIHISYERLHKSVKSTSDFKNINFYDLRDSFMKKPRLSKNFAIYKDYKYIFVEREPTNNLGIEKKEAPIEKGYTSFFVTDIERTLIDCVVAPHRAGGISTVIASFKGSNDLLDLGKMYDFYKQLEFLYPYWQRIGFIIEKSLGKELSEKWDSFFSRDKKEFFLMHEYRADWKLDEKWKLYYPKGLDF
ncbi:MAG: hypothetical protein IEMM0002_0769 [bacterium]|nr:MAG: hypothetical protein IEMM0002_0769 [bacterium]